MCDSPTNGLIVVFRKKKTKFIGRNIGQNMRSFVKLGTVLG